MPSDMIGHSRDCMEAQGWRAGNSSWQQQKSRSAYTLPYLA